MKIGVSTLAFGKKSREQIIQLAEAYDWTIEFSSSFPHSADMADFFKSIKIDRFAHNYFPAPEQPFVLNLASTDHDIRTKSIAHCIQGLEISKQAGADCFSAHAGFCIDPDPKTLGHALTVEQKINRDLNWSLFLESVNLIVREAEHLEMSFYIENNVTARFNLRKDGQEVLLCSSAGELVELYNSINKNNFGILLDTAHLKVSANALNFNKEEAVNELRPYVKYIHHSDNSGDKDTNEPLDDSYWFLSFIRDFKGIIHILEVKNITVKEILNQISLLENHG